MAENTDWLAELQRLSISVPEDNGLLTVTEMCEQLGKGERAVRQMLAQANKMGLLFVGKKQVRRINGTYYPADAYKVELPKKHKK